jgi:hypothetical protein
MTRLTVHWHLVQKSDGRRHLDMAWEAGQARKMPGLSRSQTQAGANHK